MVHDSGQQTTFKSTLQSVNRTFTILNLFLAPHSGLSLFIPAVAVWASLPITLTSPSSWQKKRAVTRARVFWGWMGHKVKTHKNIVGWWKRDWLEESRYGKKGQLRNRRVKRAGGRVLFFMSSGDVLTACRCSSAETVTYFLFYFAALWILFHFLSCCGSFSQFMFQFQAFSFEV